MIFNINSTRGQTRFLTCNFFCPGEERIFVTVFAGVDCIVCFAIEMSNATQNWLKMSDGKAK